MVCKTAQTAPSLASSQVSSTVTKDKRSEFSKKLRHQEKALNLSEKDRHQLKRQNSFVSTFGKHIVVQNPLLNFSWKAKIIKVTETERGGTLEFSCNILASMVTHRKYLANCMF